MSLDKLHFWQMLFGDVRQLPTNATSWGSMPGGQIYNAGETNITAVITRPCVFRNLRCVMVVAPGGAQTYIITLRKNLADTAITVTISGAATTGNDLTHQVAFATGDLISLKIVASATAAASGLQWGIEMSSD
jgi:hypothetical protein